MLKKSLYTVFDFQYFYLRILSKSPQGLLINHSTQLDYILNMYVYCRNIERPFFQKQSLKYGLDALLSVLFCLKL